MDSHHTPASSFVPETHPLTRLLKILNNGDEGDASVRTLPLDKKLSAGVCEKQARAFGFSAKMYSLRFASIPCETVPVILETERGDGFLVLTEKIDQKSARVILSDGRESVVSTELLSSVYSGRCLFLKGKPTLAERFNRGRSTIQQGWTRYKADMIAALTLNLAFAAIVLFTGMNSDTLLRELDSGGAMMPVYATVLAGIMALAYSLIRPGLAQPKKKVTGNWFFQNSGPLLRRNEFAALVDLPTALIFAVLALVLGKFAALPAIGIGIMIFCTFVASRHMEFRSEPIGEANGSVVRSVFVITAIFAGILASNQQITTGGMIGTVIFTSIAMQLLFRSRSLVQRSKLIRFLQPREERKSVYVFGGNSSLDTGFEFDQVRLADQENSSAGKVSFAIGNGERIALYGSKNSGRSEIFRLMTGRSEAASGEISLNGISMDQFCETDLNRCVGLLGPDCLVMEGTLRSNLALGNLHATDSQLLEALNAAGLSYLLDDEQGRGLDLPVREGGVGLTLLERQCLCLARAVVGRPQILLLDEPSARLDTLPAERFYELVELYLDENRARTAIISTAKVTMPELVDRVMVMEKGALVGDGPVEEMGERVLLEDDLPKAFSRLLAS